MSAVSSMVWNEGAEALIADELHDTRPCTVDSTVLNHAFGPWTLHFGPWTLDIGHCTIDYGL